MDKITTYLSENPHTLGLVFSLFGIIMLISAIAGAKWLFKKDVSGVTYSLKKVDGWINMFGVKTARIIVGIGAILIILSGMIWFLISTL